jgi:HAD superfamily hydrolase (TIGR01509 family)
MIEAVIYDYDGVLADSLGAHVDFCRDQNEKRGLGLDIPPREEGRRIAGNPMDNFLRHAGFPEELIPEILEEYRTTFNSTYAAHVKLFPDVDIMLILAAFRRQKLGIASSNIHANILPVLGFCDSYFQGNVFSKDNSRDKEDGIRQCLSRMRVEPSQAVFVDDTYHGHDLAQKVGTGFIGVTYGWEIDQEGRYRGNGVPLAHSVRELMDKIGRL